MVDNLINRRSVLKMSGSTVAGIGVIGGRVSADSEKGELEKKKEESDYLETETYIEGEDLTYMRAKNSKKDLILRLDGKKGEAKFAEIKSNVEIETLSPESTVDASLEDQVRSMTSDSTAVNMQSTTANNRQDSVNSVEPTAIVNEAQGVQAASSGTIFNKVDAEWEEDIGNCGSVYNHHNYLHIAFELQTHDLDDIPSTVGWSMFCAALLHLVGKKVKIVKKILQSVPDGLIKKVGGAIPSSLCGILFGRTLDNAFSGSDGTVALWDMDNNGPLTSPKLAVGASNIYDADPEYMREYRKTDQYQGIHTAQLT